MQIFPLNCKKYFLAYFHRNKSAIYREKAVDHLMMLAERMESIYL